MHSYRRLAAVSTVLLTAAGLLITGSPAKAATVPVAGTGKATAHSVTVHSSQILFSAVPGPVLGRDGKPAGPAGTRTARPAARPAPPPASAQRGGPNSGSARTAVLARPATTTGKAPLTDPSFGGATQATSNCSSCTTPYVTAAVNGTEVAETVNLSLQVFSKSGTRLCAESLTDLLGAIGGLTEPRIQYDNAAKRYSMVIASTPSSSSDVPVFFLATSQADDACGAWWVYQIVLTGSQYPLGGQLNYPYLGQDSVSLLASTNNYTFGSSYLGTGAFSMPKADAYAGNSFNVTTYAVDFSTAPVTVDGIPTLPTTTTYWVAAVPGVGFDVFSMPTSPAGAITFVGTAGPGFNPPSRRVRQPGTSDTLNPLDGRIQSAAAQDGSVIWFSNDIDYNGFPTVLYGAIDGSSGQTETALAFHSNTSDDFSPSIGVSHQGSNTVAIWLNWAYTDTSSGVPVSVTINGVAPGAGVPDLLGSDLTLVTGVSATSITTFGAYSSVEVDPVAASSTCPAGLTALSAQEYFPSASQWGTELARTTFC
ncbi:MAG TPA: hypothetical protein VKU39_09485 [Streptosporangiaceae bacterium]|nr:hypothetical protein [Streptosporangiaceae bacterium]